MKFLNIRYNRAVYSAYLAVFAAMYIAFALLLPDPVRIQELLLLFVCVPRLHDIGRSGWWAVVAFAVEVAMAIALLWAAIAFDMPRAQVETLTGVIGLVLFGAVAWLALVPGKPEPNRWGAPPPPGLRGWNVKAGPAATGPYPPNA